MCCEAAILQATVELAEEWRGTMVQAKVIGHSYSVKPCSWRKECLELKAVTRNRKVGREDKLIKQSMEVTVASFGWRAYCYKICFFN
jgi:hypothetical protein